MLHRRCVRCCVTLTRSYLIQSAAYLVSFALSMETVSTNLQQMYSTDLCRSCKQGLQEQFASTSSRSVHDSTHRVAIDNSCSTGEDAKKRVVGSG